MRVVGSGHALLAPEVTRRVIERMTTGTQHAETTRKPKRTKDLELLTNREREVLVLIGRGLSNGELASTLFVGEATVKTHVSNVLAKLHLRDRVQAVVLAHEAGLIPESDEHNPTAG